MRRVARIDDQANLDDATSLADGGASAPVRTVLELAGRESAALRVGLVRLAPGQRVPSEGRSSHVVDEVSLIVTGALTGESGGDAFELGAGDVTWIPAGESHWARAGENGAEIFWVWFGEVEREDDGPRSDHG